MFPAASESASAPLLLGGGVGLGEGFPGMLRSLLRFGAAFAAGTPLAVDLFSLVDSGAADVVRACSGCDMATSCGGLPACFGVGRRAIQTAATISAAATGASQRQSRSDGQKEGRCGGAPAAAWGGPARSRAASCSRQRAHRERCCSYRADSSTSSERSKYAARTSGPGQFSPESRRLWRRRLAAAFS